MSACEFCGVDHDREDALAEHSHEITKLTAALAAAERRAEEAERERDEARRSVSAVGEEAIQSIAGLLDAAAEANTNRHRRAALHQAAEALRALAAPAASPDDTPERKP